MASNDKPIKAYPSSGRTGWYAVDKTGRTWPISSSDASGLPKGKTYDELKAACRIN